MCCSNFIMASICVLHLPPAASLMSRVSYIYTYYMLTRHAFMSGGYIFGGNWVENSSRLQQ